MSIGSPNRTVIKSLIETLQRAVDPAKLYDLLKKMFFDLDKVYTTLFEGPLPAVSGENLTNLSREGMPDGVAYTDVANVFTEDQLIQKLRPALELRNEATVGVLSAILARFKQIDDTKTLFSSGIDFDGTNYIDDAGTGAGIEINGDTGEILFIQVTGGIKTVRARISPAGLLSLGILPLFETGSIAGDLLIANVRSIRSVDAAAGATYSMIVMDGNDLIGLGRSAANTGKGHVTIPRVAAVDIPAAGVSRNGIILIDSTNNRICYFNNNLRYFMPAGTAF